MLYHVHDLENDQYYSLPPFETPPNGEPPSQDIIESMITKIVQGLPIKGDYNVLTRDEYFQTSHHQNVQSSIEEKAARKEIKQARLAKLDLLCYDTGDGEIQTRPQDLMGIQAAIAVAGKGNRKINWIMADNTQKKISKNDLEAALEYGQEKMVTIYEQDVLP